MKPEIKAKWVKALRSGEYKQGRNRLRDGDSFCCLGVLCNLHAQDHPKTAATQNNPAVYLGYSQTTPPRVARWAGLTIDGYEDEENELMWRNDGLNGRPKHNFRQIADYIEKNL
jgi:hypothetical protein